MVTETAIFNHARMALNAIQNDDIETAIVHLEKFIIPNLAELALANNSNEPGCKQWDSLIEALRKRKY